MTRREFEITDPNEIESILQNSKIVHIGLVDDGLPYVLPMNYGYEFIDGALTLYLHGAKEGYKLDVIRKNPTCCFEIECEVTPFEGKVACQYGTSYKSIIGRGKAKIIEDPQRKIRDLAIFMKTQTGKDFEFNEKLVSIVSVIEIHADEYTAKHRPIPEGLKSPQIPRSEA